MNDSKFFQWIHDRLVEVHGENPLYDYVHRLRKVISNRKKPVDVDRPMMIHFDTPEQMRLFGGFRWK